MSYIFSLTFVPPPPLPGVGLVFVYLRGRGERTEATGARCDDRRSLALKIELCSQRRETQES